MEFVVSGSGDEFVDLPNSYLHLRVKITKPDGTNIVTNTTSGTTVTDGADASVGPVNAWMHAIFSQVDVSLNETLVSPSTNTYPYRAYLETLLSYGKDAKSSWLSAELWHDDEAGKMDGNDNDGLTKRRKFVENSKEADLYGKIHSDLFNVDRLIPSGVNISIKLVRSKDAFALMSNASNASYRIVITHAAFYVRKVKLSSPAQMLLMKGLEKDTFKYPLRRIVCKYFSVPAGNMIGQQSKVFQGQLPNRVVLGCVENGAFNGAYAKNPFNFKHFGANFVALKVNGQQVPATPLQPNFTNKKYARCYASLFTATGMHGDDAGNRIHYEDYGKGFTLYAFDLTPDHNCDGGHTSPIKMGDVDVELHFTTTLANTINVVVYGEFDNVLEIDRNRSILFDYTA